MKRERVLPATIWAIAELCRIANLPTAWADILCGWLVSLAMQTGPNQGQVVRVELGLLLLASSGLYLSGMVWNDVFDVETDRLDRPQRPIPSGRVSRRCASWLAIILMGTGWLAAGVVAWMRGTELPLVLATLLALFILVYDAGGKRFVWGVMWLAACRATNVILGGSLAFSEALVPLSAIALVNGVYVSGVSLIARRETQRLIGLARELLAGVIALGLAGVGLILVWLAAGTAVWRNPTWTEAAGGGWWWLVAGLAGAWALAQTAIVRLAARRPEPARLQATVGRLLQGIIFLDAFLAFPVAGPVALGIIVLWPVAVWLGRRFAPT